MTKECIVVIKIGFIIMVGDQPIVHPMPFSIFLLFFFALVVAPSQ
jgi:hypothetical protein